MAGPRFDDPVYGSNVVTGISATGNAHQTFNFNQHFESRPFFLFPYEKHEDFVTRPEILSKLEELLPKNSDDFRSAALWGLEGSGKTQIALDFAYSRYSKRQCSVFWVHANSEATFAQDYGSIASVLGMNAQGSVPELLQNVRHRIESLPRWLLIIDNADDLSLLGVGLAARNTSKMINYIPKGPNGTILWISRDEAIVGSLVGYLNDLKEEETRWRISKEPEFDRYRLHNSSNSILETWSSSVHLIRQENELAYKILHILAYMDKQEITERLLDAAAAHGETKPMEDMFESKKREAIRRLKNFSFLIEHHLGNYERIYEIHKLVKDAIRYKLRNASILNGHANKANKDSRRLGVCIKRRFANNGSSKGVSRKGEEYFAGVAVNIVASTYPHKTHLKTGKAP
ncbi:hypothetical protein ACJA88_003667 [Fusarium oxysporum]